MAISSRPAFDRSRSSMRQQGYTMRPIEGLAIAPNMQDRKPKTLAALEFQTTLVGIMGHDLRQSLHVIQGTYLLGRRATASMAGPWRAGRHKADGTTQLPGRRLLSGGTGQYVGNLPRRTWSSVLAASTRKRRCRPSTRHRSSSNFNECACGQ